ncbi:MAG TPA: Uma2 family endonuclease [Stellaceae bacterium]|nr:Uma2 family endonuclease [Stellaceae bacterium]
MPSAAQNLMTLDDFLAWEREQPERHEFADGVVYMMTGASLPHVIITGNLFAALRAALRGSGCRPLASDAKVVANGAVRYPDVTVTCHPITGGSDIVPEPVVVIEVLSPTTERADRGRKKFDYFATPSVRQYAIVEQDERLIDLYTRVDGGWTDEIVNGDSALRLSSIGVDIPLDAIYEDIELGATRRPASEAPTPAG